MASRAAYEAHLRGTVLPSLHGARDAIARVDADIHDYEQVARRLARDKAAGAGAAAPRTAPVEIGAGVWGDAVVHSTKQVTLDLGLDIHLPLPAAEAQAYAAARAALLRKRRGVLAQRAERLAWEVGQFEGALQGQPVLASAQPQAQAQAQNSH